MGSKSQHTKLLSSIKEAVQSSSDEENVSFIVGSILLFEQYYAATNKENFRKILNEALAVFGPGTPFDGDDRVISLYILLGKYSRSSTPAEIYDRMNETGTYRKSAMFYIEWSKVFHQAGHTSRAKEIICDGMKRNAKPEHLLEAFINEYGLESAVATKTPSRPLQNSAPRSARKQLFPKAAPVIVPKASPVHFVMPGENTMPEIDPSRIVPLTNESIGLLPLPIDLEERSEDAENVRPTQNADEMYVRRKTLGILIPATGFTLEDYDLAKVYEEEEKREVNKANIDNGAQKRGSSCSPTSSSAVRALFQSVNPTVLPSMPVPRPALNYNHSNNNFLPADAIFPPSPTERRSPVQEEIFVTAADALRNLRPTEEEEMNLDDRRLTGLEKTLLKRKKSLAGRQSLANPKPPPPSDTLDVLFSKMKMASPGGPSQE